MEKKKVTVSQNGKAGAISWVSFGTGFVPISGYRSVSRRAGSDNKMGNNE